MPQDFRSLRPPAETIGFHELRQACEISALREDLERVLHETSALRDAIEDAVGEVRTRFAALTPEQLADSAEMAPLLQFAVGRLIALRDRARALNLDSGPVPDEARPAWAAGTAQASPAQTSPAPARPSPARPLPAVPANGQAPIPAPPAPEPAREPAAVIPPAEPAAPPPLPKLPPAAPPPPRSPAPDNLLAPVAGPPGLRRPAAVAPAQSGAAGPPGSVIDWLRPARR